MNRDALSIQLLGYEVRTDDDAVVGEVEGVRPHGMRLTKITGHPGHHGYLPTEAVGAVDRRTGTIRLVPGISAGSVVDAPPPPGEDPDAWHTSPEWWADLLGHYGLSDPRGRSNQPFLHAGRS